MLRVRFRKYHNGHHKGDIVEVDNNVAFGLVDSKIAEITDESVTSTEAATLYEDKIITSGIGLTYKTK
jgi:hypothetical protein